jgi:hypothetical protein
MQTREVASNEPQGASAVVDRLITRAFSDEELSFLMTSKSFSESRALVRDLDDFDRLCMIGQQLIASREESRSKEFYVRLANLCETPALMPERGPTGDGDPHALIKNTFREEELTFLMSHPAFAEAVTKVTGFQGYTEVARLGENLLALRRANGSR